MTFAPGIGSPVAASVTLPDTFPTCAESVIGAISISITNNFAPTKEDLLKNG